MTASGATRAAGSTSRKTRTLGTADLRARCAGLEAVQEALHLPAAQALVSASIRPATLAAELTEVTSAAQTNEKWLYDNVAKLAVAERQLRELDFTRDGASDAAAKAMQKLQAAESVPTWPPQKLTVVRSATRPERAAYTL